MHSPAGCQKTKWVWETTEAEGSHEGPGVPMTKESWGQSAGSVYDEDAGAGGIRG